MHWKTKNTRRIPDEKIAEIDEWMREKKATYASAARRFNISVGTLSRRIEEYRADEWIREIKR